MTKPTTAPEPEPPAAVTIAALWDRESALLAELNRIGDPLESAESIEAALATIQRRRELRDELEAVRATKRAAIERQRAAERRAHTAVALRQSIAELEAELPRARARDERLGPSNRPTPSYAETVERKLEHRRQQLADLEAGGEVTGSRG